MVFNKLKINKGSNASETISVWVCLSLDLRLTGEGNLFRIKLDLVKHTLRFGYKKIKSKQRNGTDDHLLDHGVYKWVDDGNNY